jgi:putative membrane protein
MSSSSYKKIAAALLSAGFVAGAFAQGFGPAPALAPADRKFLEEAAVDGMAEVELGRLAQQKASSDSVKKFGARMAADHAKANAELKALMPTRNVPIPNGLDKKHQKQIDELDKMSPMRFDHEYMEQMVSDHKKDVEEFKQQAQSAKDPAIKAFAAKTLPTLESHLKQAEAVKAALR